MEELRSPGRWRVRAGAAVVLVLVALGCAVLVSALTDPGTQVQVERPDPTAAPTGGDSILVHILGAVRTPGLYEVREGARAVDVVAAAGGFLENADQAALNLARPVADGEQIMVPVIGATPPGPPGASVGGKIDLNTADAAALETLPRVGPALAARILAWRDANGRFTVVEDLLSVSGIGDATFAELKDLVTV